MDDRGIALTKNKIVIIISMDRLKCITSTMRIQECGVSVCDLETSPVRWPTVRVGLLQGNKKEGGGERGRKTAPFICCPLSSPKTGNCPVHLLPFELTKNW